MKQYVKWTRIQTAQAFNIVKKQLLSTPWSHLSHSSPNVLPVLHQLMVSDDMKTTEIVTDQVQNLHQLTWYRTVTLYNVGHDFPVFCPNSVYIYINLNTFYVIFPYLKLYRHLSAVLSPNL
jgi:hypothetical protein